MSGPLMVTAEQTGLWFRPVVTDELLLPLFGSPGEPVTVAVFVIVEPADSALTTTLNVCEPPTRMLAAVQDTTGDTNPHPAEAETNETFAGSESDTVTAVAVSGPAFDATSEYVNVWPSVTAAGPC